MFDIGFWELALILVVALIVVGPERLPGLARTVGLWVGKARRFVASVKADIDRELQAEEIKKLLNNQAQEVAHLRDMLNDTRAAVEKDINSTKSLSSPPAKAAPPAPPTDGSV